MNTKLREQFNEFTFKKEALKVDNSVYITNNVSIYPDGTYNE